MDNSLYVHFFCVNVNKWSGARGGRATAQASRARLALDGDVQFRPALSCLWETPA
jgi:hypothetical protein